MTAGQFDAHAPTQTLYIHKTNSVSDDVSSWLEQITTGTQIQLTETFAPGGSAVYRITSPFTLTGDVYSWTWE